MKRKIIAILLATLMSATMFAGMATVTADEKECFDEGAVEWVNIYKMSDKENCILNENIISKSADYGLLDVFNEFGVNSVLNTGKNSIDYDPGDMNTSFFKITELAEFGQTVRGLAAADFNNDGLLDFAASWATSPRTYSSITIFYNQGDLTFTQEEVYRIYDTYIMDLAAADVDQDDDTDLLFTYNEIKVMDNGWGYYTNGTINVLENTGDNQFKPPEMLVWLGPYEPQNVNKETNVQLACADYDMDGDIDFVIGSNSGKVELFVNDGMGNFSSTGVMYDYGMYSWGVASGDFDGDGWIDVLVNSNEDEQGNAIDNHIYLKRNLGFPSVFDVGPGEPIVDLPLHTKFRGIGGYTEGCLASIDYNDDGLLDFLYGNGAIVFLIIQQQNGSFEPFYVCMLADGSEGYSESLKLGAFAVGDFNDDGYDDVVVGGVQGFVRLFVNTQTLIDITYPQDMWAYRFGEEWGRKFKYPGTCLVLGDITVQTKELEPLSRVEFYLDDTLMFTDEDSPFEWMWNRFSFGEHIVKAKAYDLDGNSAGFDTLKVWKFL